MVTLHKFNAAYGLSDISPFCIKVETYLRMIGMPFQSVVSDCRKAPKKKFPYVEDGGAIVCDSRDIVEHFEAKVEKPLDEALSARDRSTSTAFRGLIEEEMYFQVASLRWQRDDGWEKYAPVLSEYGAALGVPSFIRPLMLRSVRRQMLRDLWGQGTARHSPEQVDARICRVADAVAVQLGDSAYFLGDRPRTIDATVYAFFAALLEPPFESRAREHARSLDNLVAYCARMRAAYYGETKPALKVVGTAA